MSLSIEPFRMDLMEQMDAWAERHVEPEKLDRVRAFARGFYRDVPPADMAPERAEQLLAVVLSLLGLAERRMPGKPNVRAYHPRIDEHGWAGPHSVVEVITDDMPFLVDSVTAELKRMEAEVELTIHPTFHVKRDAEGKLLSIASDEPHPGADDPSLTESVMHVRVRAQSEARLEEIRGRVLKVLADVQLVVSDHVPMRVKCNEVAELLRASGSDGSDDLREVVEFLEWLVDDSFIFLGYRAVSPEASPGASPGGTSPPAALSPGLGLLREPERSLFDGTDPLPGEPALRIFKANVRSTVHRPTHLDTIIVGTRDADGNVTSGHMFVGLFSLTAYSRSPSRIPLLRHKLRRVFERAGYARSGHDGKALWFILETYPRDELFQISEDTLLKIAVGVLHLQNRQRVALFVRRDPLARFVSCIVYVPRDRFDTALRLRIQHLLATAHRGSVSAYYTHVGDQVLARLHVIVKTPDGAEDVDYPSLERRLAEESRSWQDRLLGALTNEYGEERGTESLSRYGCAFPGGYTESHDEFTAVVDIQFVERALGSRDVAMHLYKSAGSGPEQLRFKLYSPGVVVRLSKVLPVLENLGLLVEGEVQHEIKPETGAEPAARVWLHDFYLSTRDRRPVGVADVREDFERLFSDVWHERTENDGFNTLMLSAGLRAHEVAIPRAYSQYLQQCNVPFSLPYIERALANNPQVTRRLVDLFNTRFDPGLSFAEGVPRETAADTVLRDVRAALDLVRSLDEDRILRRLLNVVRATIRTNYFQRDEAGAAKPWLSLKLDSSKVEGLPSPRPFREIFVTSPWMEGVHLRFGKVARGGLRWSDRREDYRTEVLGLVKAQQVKNAVIVPVGSKGGFVVKRPRAADEGREAWQKEGIRCYETFIQGLLDLTDNRRGTELVHPDRTIRYDEPDPYLVVAADKGTATFSDIANAISKRYGFWLDDAFASGGSAGYDHKKMAITARGAWESVKRHFRELGKDIQEQDFTCVGVGDMAGDVFGNGMLLSKHIRLVAAFNHQHVFLDPSPDAERSWQERQRLFQLPGSSWGDYDRTCLSPGSAIFERSAKSVTLTPEIRVLLGTKETELTPADVIRLVLVLDVELLFFGGIGTFVKGSKERDTDVGDRANDALRVKAKKLKAKIIGEGANLGMTQRGRIEFALRGGLCNTDFVDNSAGVDCSDHEVNLKILFGAVEQAGDITRKQRDDLLREMTEEVAALVLRDNVMQTLTLSVTESFGNYLTDRLVRYMRWLEKRKVLDRRLESLPSDDELAERRQRGQGFARPELCVLLSYCKNDLATELADSPLPDDPFLERDLAEYFPARIQSAFLPAVLTHRLRREIIATVVVNDLVNRMGITFVYELMERTGHTAAQVARAYVAARELLGMRQLWLEIEALAVSVPARVQADVFVECSRLLTRTAARLLAAGGGTLTIPGALDEFHTGVQLLSGSVFDLLGEADRAVALERQAPLAGAGVPGDLARRIAVMPHLLSACDLVRVAEFTNSSVTDVAKLYFATGQRFGFEWLRQMARSHATATTWEKEATNALIEELFDTQKNLTLSILDSERCDGEPEAAINRWAASHTPALLRHERLSEEVRSSEVRGLAMLTVANHSLKALLDG